MFAMKRLALVLGLLLVPAVHATCPISAKCEIDGATMLEETCYYNNSQKYCRFGHDYSGPNGKEHHYVIKKCDE